MIDELIETVSLTDIAKLNLKVLRRRRVGSKYEIYKIALN